MVSGAATYAIISNIVLIAIIVVLSLLLASYTTSFLNKTDCTVETDCVKNNNLRSCDLSTKKCVKPCYADTDCATGTTCGADHMCAGAPATATA